jgi:cyclohexanone monooxygenase
MTPATSPTSPGTTLPDRVGIFIVGAGFAGLAAAIKLQEVGHGDFLVIDRGSEVGGTWRDNSYPGAACDVPSQLYSFSFSLNPDWSRSFSPQSEIQDYLRRVASESAVLDRFRFNVTLLEARWDSDASQWQLRTSAGDLTAEMLVIAAGALSEPRMPAIEGIEDFAGETFHSARWNHESELAGKRIAVIGTGASAIQIVPEIAPDAGRVDVYQRTAPWVVPRRDRRLTSAERFLYRRIPGAQRLARSAVYWGREATVPMFTLQPGLGRFAERTANRHIDRAISDPELRRQVTPRFALGCKRVLLSNDWYPALSRDNVELITSPITRVTANAVLTADGREHQTDVIVVATGFMPTELPIARHIVGPDGTSLAEHWAARGMQAYKGATVAGFPNLFFVVGPNTGLGHSSMVLVIESQVAYLVDAVRTMRRHELATVEVRARTQASFNARLQRRMRRTVWNTGGCSSWYLDAHGRNVTLWPRSTLTFRRITARFDLAAYRSTAKEDLGGTRPARNPETTAATTTPATAAATTAATTATTA